MSPLVPSSSRASFVGINMGAYEPAGPVVANLDIRQMTTATGGLADGTLDITTIDLPAGLVVSTIYWLSGTTALINGATPHYWTALFDNNRNLLRQTPDNTAKAIPVSSVISDALSSPFQTTYAGQHYIGIMVASGAGTQPTHTCLSSLTAIMGLLSSGGGKFNGTSSTGLGAVAPNPAAAITQNNTIPWVGVS